VTTRLPTYGVTVPETAGPVKTHELPLADSLVDSLRQVAGRLGVPLPAIVLAAHVAVVGFVAGTAEVLTSCQRFGPPEPVRARLDAGGSWADLVAAVQKVEEGGGAGRPGTAFAVGNGSIEGECPFEARLVSGGPTGGVSLQFHYRADEYRPEQVEQYACYYHRALQRISYDVTGTRRDADLLGAEEEAQLRSLSGPTVALPDGTFVDLFDRQVRLTPERIALASGRRRLSYAELDAESERVAEGLRRHAVAPGDVVTTLVSRDVEWAVTVLAVLKLGAVYLPQDLEYPPDRIGSVLRRSGCRHVVTDTGMTGELRTALREQVPDLCILDYREVATGQPARAPASRPAASDPAYIIFTSGSTGEPKGAVISHTGMLNHLLAKARDFRLAEADRIAQTATQCFDISIWQLLNAWLCGATTWIYSRYDQLDVPGFLRALANDRITVVEVVPSYLDLMLAEVARRPVELPALRLNVVTGEPLPPALTHRWFGEYPGVPLVNAYGPTEASDDVTHHHLERPVTTVRVPVGRPIINTGIHVVAPDGCLRPLGSYGEICVTGSGVGMGYVNDPERTAAAFPRNTLDDRSDRTYRTGDIGRWLPGGLLDCAGRSDDQVKVRGYRIELSDVEGALVRLPGVEAAVAVARELGGQTRLVAYFTGPAAPDLAAFQRGLADLLPTYMHPENVVRLERFPLTSRGKVDRGALARRPI
jgi:amino acid adenylation domain-containing protein